MTVETKSWRRALNPAMVTEHYLEDHEVPFKVFDHAERFTAAAEAQASGVAPHRAAKCVLLHDGERYCLAVIPASERLDLRKARRAMGAKGDLRLASEAEMAREFPVFEVGALPPLGRLLGLPELIDPQVLDHERILCAAGDHGHSLFVASRALMNLSSARVADICED